MMKKAAILLITWVVVYLFYGYHVQRQHELGKKFIMDAYQGDLLSVKEDWEQGAPPDYTLYLQDSQRGYGGIAFTALQAAASGGNEDVIHFLLEEGYSIDYPTPQGWTPLFIAVRDGRTEAAKLLIYRQADLNAQTDHGATALMMAITQPFPSEKEREDLLVYMLKRGADPNLPDYMGNTPLYYAAAVKNVRIVELLQEYGATPDAQTKEKINKLFKNNPDNAAKKILAVL